MACRAAHTIDRGRSERLLSAHTIRIEFTADLGLDFNAQALRIIIAAALGALLFTACSGSQTTSPMPSNLGVSSTPSAPVPTQRGYPKPWTSSSGYTPAKLNVGFTVSPTSWQYHQHVSGLLSALRAHGNNRMPQGSVPGRDQGGDAGYHLYASSATGEWAAMDAYEVGGAGTLSPSFVNFDPEYNHLLYAPTTLPANNACIEFGIQYDNTASTGSQESYFYAADWCKGAFQYTDPTTGVTSWYPTEHNLFYINDSFYQKYVRVFTNGDSDPQVVAEEKLEPDGNWHLLLWDANPPCSNSQQCDIYGHTYVDVYDTPNQTSYAPTAPATNPSGNGYSPNSGWSFFETHFDMDNAGSDCPVLPQMGVSGLRSQSAEGSSYWPSSSVWNLTGLVEGCFNLYDGASPTYTFEPNDDTGWWVYSGTLLLATLPINDARYPAWPDTRPLPHISPPPPCLKCRLP